MPLTLILARARNGAIGRGRGMPWHLPEEMAHFKASTMGATLLVGRRTWETIGRPLPGRRMIVLSRRGLDLPGAPASGSSERSLAAAPGSDALVEAISAEGAPADRAPADRAPAGGAPADGAPATGSAANRGPVKGASGDWDSVEWAPDLDTALERARQGGPSAAEIFVIGGAELYRQALPRADRILLTEIDLEPEADTYFDLPFGADWELRSRSDRESADGTRFAILDLRRRPTAATGELPS